MVTDFRKQFFEFTEDEYDRLYIMFQNGMMTYAEWEKYSTEWLNILMKMNKKVLDNLKN